MGIGSKARPWAFRLPEAEQEYLREEAARRRSSMASVLLQALCEYRERQEKRDRLDRILDELELGAGDPPRDKGG